jgi:hypothetical protein
MKKIFSTFFVVLLVVTSVFGFSACGMNVEEINIAASLSTKKEYLLTNVYDKTAGTDFNDTEGDDYVIDDNYYVTVKSGVVDVLTSITIGGFIFEDDDTVSLSVGNNNYLIRNAWKIEEESLKIASGLLLSSTSSEGKVAVRYGGMDLSLITLDDPSNVNFDITVEGTNATITGPTSNVYTYTSSNYAGYFKIKITDESDTNLLTASSVITVEKVKKDTEGNVIGITYGLTKTDLIGDEYFLVFYPAYNAGEAYSATNPADFTMEFKFLVLGVGADSFTFNFVNSVA